MFMSFLSSLSSAMVPETAILLPNRPHVPLAWIICMDEVQKTSKQERGLTLAAPILVDAAFDTLPMLGFLNATRIWLNVQMSAMSCSCWLQTALSARDKMRHIRRGWMEQRGLSFTRLWEQIEAIVVRCILSIQPLLGHNQQVLQTTHTVSHRLPHKRHLWL